MADDRNGHQTPDGGRRLEPVRHGRPRDRHRTRHDLGCGLAPADLPGRARLRSHAVRAMVVRANGAGTVLAGPARDHMGSAASAGDEGSAVHCGVGQPSFVLSSGSNSPSISTKATTHGALERLLQAWLVPHWTTTSPAFSNTSSLSSTMVISPESTSA